MLIKTNEIIFDGKIKLQEIIGMLATGSVNTTIVLGETLNKNSLQLILRVLGEMRKRKIATPMSIIIQQHLPLLQKTVQAVLDAVTRANNFLSATFYPAVTLLQEEQKIVYGLNFSVREFISTLATMHLLPEEATFKSQNSSKEQSSAQTENSATSSNTNSSFVEQLVQENTKLKSQVIEQKLQIDVLQNALIEQEQLIATLRSQAPNWTPYTRSYANFFQLNSQFSLPPLTQMADKGTEKSSTTSYANPEIIELDKEASTLDF